MSFINNITPNEIAGKIFEDALDTMDKINKVLPLVMDISSLDVGETIEDIPYSEVTQSIGTIITDDGDGILLKLNNEGNLVNVITGAEGTGNTERVIGTLSPVVDGKVNLTLVNDTFYDLSGAYEWSNEEVFQTLTDTFSTNDLMSRAADLVSKGEYSREAFNASCSDVLQNLSGNSLHLYSVLINNVDSSNPFSFIQVAKSIYGNIEGATSTGNTIEFSDNGYFVKGFLSTFSDLVTGTIAPILSTIAFVVNPILGIAVTALTFVWNGVKTYIANKGSSEATIDYQSLNRMYGQPVWQTTVNKSALDSESQSIIDDLLSKSSLIEIVGPGITTFIWSNDNGTTISYESFANLYAEGPYDPDSDEANFQGLIYVEGSGYDRYTEIGTSIKPESFFHYSEEYSRVGRPVSANYYSDSEIKRMVCEGIWNAHLWALGSFYPDNTSYVIEMGSYSTTFTYTNWTLLGYSLFPVGTLPSWSDIVNTIVPSLQNWVNTMSGTPGIAKVKLLQNILKSSRYQEIWAGRLETLGTTLLNTNERGNWYVVPPSYTPGALIWAMIAVAATAVAAVALVKVSKVFLRRTADKFLSRKSQQALAAYDQYQITGDSADYQAYAKAARKYNLFARVLGGSTLSTVSPWLSSGSSNTSIFSNGSIFSNDSANKIIKLIKN